jgi:hypothetical protein
MTRIAHCCCGSLRAEATGEPSLVGVCHCTECQRRTGSAFGVNTYFPKDQVRTEGRAGSTVRGSNSGRKIELHFCPDCGASVFWYAEFPPDQVGIALRAFAGPLPWPTLSVWETTQHPWVTFGRELNHFAGQPELIEGPVAAHR